MITLNGDTGIILPQNAELEITADNGISAPAANTIALNTNGTQRLLVDSSGNFGLGTGAPAKTLDVVGDIRTSTGILFGSDTAAANTLDDYEEGTWTPILSDGTNDATNDSNLTSGQYVKIGNTVYVNCQVILTSKGSISGGIRLYGLPFTVADVKNTNAFGLAGLSGGNLSLSSANQNPVVSLARNDTFGFIALWKLTSGVQGLTDSDLNNNSAFKFQGFYQV